MSLNKVMCLVHDFIPSNLMTKLNKIIKIIIISKLNDQNNSFYNSIDKIILVQNFSFHLESLLKNQKTTNNKH